MCLVIWHAVKTNSPVRYILLLSWLWWEASQVSVNSCHGYVIEIAVLDYRVSWWDTLYWSKVSSTWNLHNSCSMWLYVCIPHKTGRNCWTSFCWLAYCLMSQNDQCRMRQGMIISHAHKCIIKSNALFSNDQFSWKSCFSLASLRQTC